MIDPIAAPILLKTLDWLFGEGSKILQERRERHRVSQDAGTEIRPAHTSPSVPTDSIVTKEAAMGIPIDGQVWLDSEPKVRHLLSLLEINAKNYYLAKEQYAKWGSALVPPIITHNLAEAENGIATTTKELQAVLSNVYGKRVVAQEVERA